MNGLLKINVPQFFLALSYIFAQNKPLFTYFSSIFLKIVLKINVRISLFRCHVCTVVIKYYFIICTKTFTLLTHVPKFHNPYFNLIFK